MFTSNHEVEMAKKINIGNTDGNADWIKSLPGHKDEVAIHDALAKKLKKKEEKEQEKS